MERIVNTIGQGNQSVEVVEVEGMTGYRFDAVGRDSLPLAVELAVLQTQEPWKLSNII